MRLQRLYTEGRPSTYARRGKDVDAHYIFIHLIVKTPRHTNVLETMFWNNLVSLKLWLSVNCPVNYIGIAVNIKCFSVFHNDVIFFDV